MFLTVVFYLSDTRCVIKHCSKVLNFLADLLDQCCRTYYNHRRNPTVYYGDLLVEDISEDDDDQQVVPQRSISPQNPQCLIQIHAQAADPQQEAIQAIHPVGFSEETTVSASTSSAPEPVSEEQEGQH